MDDISENLEDASTKYWPENMFSSSKAMLEEVKRAVDATLDWWAEVTDFFYSRRCFDILHPLSFSTK